MATNDYSATTNTTAEMPLTVTVKAEEDNDKKAAAKTRTLYRHPTDKRLGGVSGGLGDYFNIDPVLIRILWILAAIASGGVALLAYGALWLVLPQGTQEAGETESAAFNLGENGMAKLAYGLIGLGIIWFLANTGILPGLWSGFWGIFSFLFWPALLIGAGIYILNKRSNNDDLTQSVKDRMPDTESVKASVKEGRQRIPLKRTTDDRILLGVCGGISRWLNIDPAIVRILWALFSIGSMGTGVILYVLLAIILPEDSSTSIESVEGEVLDPIVEQPSVSAR